jgi:hypothetical protein
MANTVSLLSYANTFGDWVVTTNALTKENNNLAANNYIKSTGTLYLSDPSLGLQVAKDAIVAGQFQVQGIGSSAYVQNNLRVDTQVYFQNTILGLTNSGQANINGLLIAQGPGTSLLVANTANVNGKLNVTGATALGNTLSVTGISTFTSNVNAQNYLNVSQDVNAINFNGTGTVNSYGLNVVGNGQVGGQFTVGGNFVINGTTVYNTNKFEINANSIVGLTSFYNVNRGVSANAQIRWNEANTYWDIRDVANPTSYSKILTANLISDSLISTSSSTIASSNTANVLYTLLTSGTNSVQSQLSANVSYISTIDNTQNTAIAIIQGTDVSQNSRMAIIEGTDVSQNSRMAIIEGTDVSQNVRLDYSNTRMTIIEGTNASQNVRLDYSNTRMTIIEDTDTSQNSRMTIIEAINVTQNTAISATNGKMQSAFDTANNRVSSITGTASQIIVTGTLTPTLSLPQSINTAASVQFGSFGVGTAATGTSGEIRATNNITAYYSDERLKTKIADIENALSKVNQIETMIYHANEVAVELGYNASIVEVGVTAQSVQRVQPEVVVPAPINDKYLTVRYDRLVPLLIEAIKELSREIEELKKK